MNQARHFDKEMLKKMGTNTPGIFLEQEFIRQKTLIEETKKEKEEELLYNQLAAKI